MITVHKFTLHKETTLTLPIGAEVLSVGPQGNCLRMWVKVGTDLPTEERVFHTFATGESMADDKLFVFIGRATTPTGLEFHVFEVLS